MQLYERQGQVNLPNYTAEHTCAVGEIIQAIAQFRLVRFRLTTTNVPAEPLVFTPRHTPVCPEDAVTM